MLNEKNIAQLYTFTRQHFVEHYDVQTELVDHLANDIEMIQETQPQLTFEQARDISFKKFGVFGFMDVVEEKQKQLSKTYWKIIFRFVKEWFKVPKILMTVLLFLCFYLILTFKNHEYFLYPLLLVFGIYEMYKLYQLRKIQKKRFKAKGKKWMLEDMFFNVGASGVIPTLTLNLYQFIYFGRTTNSLTLMLTALLLTLFFIITYIVSDIVPKKAEELLKETYPKYETS